MADRAKAAASTRSAIQAAQDGEMGDARVLLAQALSEDKDYQLAWLWFAAVTSDPAEQLYCLREAQRLKPDKTTEMAIGRLARENSPRPPEELLALTDPEPPELVGTFRADALARKRRRRIMVWSVVAALAAIVTGLVLYLNADHRPQVHIAVVAGNEPTGGPDSGQEIAAAAQWAATELNDTTEFGARVVVDYFNDDNDPKTAVQVANQVVAAGKYLAVIGHGTSATSLAARPVYQAAGIPAITPTATADSVTAGDPWYFRSVFDNRSQGEGISDYANALLGGGPSLVLYEDDAYGQSLAAGYSKAYEQAGGVTKSYEVPLTGTDEVDQAALAKLLGSPEVTALTGPIFVATHQAIGERTVRTIHTSGLTNRILTSDSMADITFYQALVAKPDGLTPAGTSRVMSATPLVRAGLSGQAVLFYQEFSNAQGYTASWAAGLTYDAFDVVVGAMARSGAKLRAGSLEADRKAIREAMDAARSVENAFPALTRPIFFDANGSAVRPVAMENGEASQAGKVRMVAADHQLVEYSPEAGVSVAEAIKQGIAVREGQRIYTVQRIVDIGVNLNELTSLNTAAGTFNADFFVWLKYPGSSDAAAIQFANAVNPALSPGEPVRTNKTTDGGTYALYRVNGAFKAAMEFSDFPFDTQQLMLEIQNSRLPSARIAYTPDPEVLDQPQAERLQSGVDASATVANMPNWKADYVAFYPSSVGNTSNLGEPRTIAGPTGVTYSQFVTDVSIARDVRSFLVKNLLPLALLVIITFISLWLPLSESSRVSFAVTGVLTGAVMLGTVTSSLANVDYTVAIAWAYYGFIALSGVMLLLTMIGRYLTTQRRLAAARKVDVFSKLFYAGAVLATIGTYVAIYG